MWFREERWRRFLDTELGRPVRPDRQIVQPFGRAWGFGLWHRNPESRGLNPAERPRRWWQWR